MHLESSRQTSNRYTIGVFMENTTNVKSTAANVDADNKGLKDKAGDLLEKVGHKISEAGAPKIGQKIHDLGDSMEKDHKNPSHPHKV